VTGLLLVTADDFGLTDGVNSGIVRAHVDGVVTSASLLAVGSAYDGAVELARRTPSLAVGVHLAAVGEDPPLLSPAEVPSLVGASGGFPLSYRSVLRSAALGRLDPCDVRREFRAQIERVRGEGLTVTHLDTHQHLHLWPVIGRIVVDLALEYGIPAVRLPRSHRHSPLGLGVRALAGALATRLAAAGLRYTSDFAGLDEAGALDLAMPRVLAGLARRGRPTAELNAHPGEAGDGLHDRFAWGYRWEHELAVLCDRTLPARIRAAGFTLASWSDLADGEGIP